jgi:hypothetical protein
MRKTGITAELRDHRWHDSSADDASPEVRIQMCGDRRIIMWADAEGVNVGALEGERAVWDHVKGTFAEAEQTAFDCYAALCLLENVRIIPTERNVTKRLRRRAARFLLRKVLRWGLVVFGWVLGAALCAATVLIGFLAGWVLP